MQTRRYYLVGAGAIAKHHMNAFNNAKREETVEIHVCDSKPETLRAFKQQFPEIIPHPDVDQMLTEPARASDMVVVATPPTSHCALTLKVLASKRHCLCEKPFAIDIPQARSMVDAAQRSGLLIGCCSVRFLESTAPAELRRILSDGTLGRIYHVSWRYRGRRCRMGLENNSRNFWFADKSRSGGGCLFDWGPYDFSYLNDVLQPREIVVRDAFAATPEAFFEGQDGFTPSVEFHVGASLEYHGPALGDFTVSYERSSCTHGHEQQLMEIEGEKGALQINWEKSLVLTTDKHGKPVEREIPSVMPEGGYSILTRPVLAFRKAIDGEPNESIIGERALFNFSVLPTILEVAASKRPMVLKA